MIKQTTVSVEELRGFAIAVGLDTIAAGRCATSFLFQLYAGTVLTPALGAAAKIVAEIRDLEGVGRAVGTKAAEAFKKPPLLGLKKKHYLVGGLPSMGRNIILAAGKKRVEFRRIARRHHNPTTADLSPVAIAKNIANDVVKLYLDRSRQGRLTGHWIVFAEHEGRNYYLCLATHEEGDDVIAERVKNGCCSEFSFLQFCS